VTRSIPQLSSDVDASRYLIERKLGQGGAGAVFLAKDRETGEHVALKKLFRMDAKSVLRLKHEFRSLVDIAHPHIVKLYDMGRADDCWFLTMEFLDGVDLTTYLAGTPPANASDARALDRSPTDRATDRLVPSFLQLARGVQALHHAGMLHRDLKPSNVLVVDARVVVLDFGLVRDLGGRAATMTEDGSIAGTPAYMAPEQIRGAELGAASDWYAFGVILYEAVSGLLPIDGSLAEILRHKLDSDPAPLHELAPAVPRWLNDLCMALLRRDPAARPNGDEIVAAFELACQRADREVPHTAVENTILTEAQSTAASTQLVGRQRELTRLRNALEEAERGSAVVVHIRGPSGTGKSSLVENFLAQIELERLAPNAADALVLRSRCYELEQMPFKALDAVMDALVRHLLHLDDLEVAQVLPHEISALAQLFPVLERLRAVKRLTSGAKPVGDAVNDRRRAELALRQLLDRLAARKPIVLWVDDLQWGDLDSARILRSWMREPTQAPILFVFSYRSEEITTSTCLARLLQVDADVTGPAKSAAEHVLDIAPLSSSDIQTLCERRLATAGPAAAALVARIVREAHGSPFLASQLTAIAETKLARGDTDLESLSIDVLVAQTSALLPDDAKRLLGVLAVAGRPMAPKLALQAAGVRRNGRAHVHALRGLNLVRTREVAGERMLEVYHDRVRERVQATLSEERSLEVHQQLFDTLEFSGQADPDWLHTLALGARQDATALQYGLAAAERANASLAFERAAELYQRCIALSPAEQSIALLGKLALALVRCGRGVQAAEAYLEAATHTSGTEAAKFRQLAALHFLRTGCFEQGEQLVRQVLQALAITVPESDAGIMAAIAWERARLKLRGMSYTPRTEAEPRTDAVARFEVLDALGAGTQQYDPLRAALFQARGLHSALDAGVPRQLVRAFSSAATAAALSGSARGGHEANALLERADALARTLSEREQGVVQAARAICAFMVGHARSVIGLSYEAERLLGKDAPDDLMGNYYSRIALAAVRVGAMFQLGEFRNMCAELQSLLREAHLTGNRSIALQFTLNQTLVEQIEGRASLSRARLDAQLRDLPSGKFGVVHLLHLVAVLCAASATGEFAWARTYMDASWARYERSPLRRSGYLALMVHAVRSRVLLNQYVVEGRRGEPPREIREDLRAMVKNASPRAGAAQRIEARLAYLAGKPQQAAGLLRVGIAAYEQMHMEPDALRDRYALGALVGGTEGAALRRAAEQRLRELGLVDPRADIAMQYPEFVEAV